MLCHTLSFQKSDKTFFFLSTLLLNSTFRFFPSEFIFHKADILWFELSAFPLIFLTTIVENKAFQLTWVIFLTVLLLKKLEKKVAYHFKKVFFSPKKPIQNHEFYLILCVVYKSVDQYFFEYLMFNQNSSPLPVLDCMQSFNIPSVLHSAN